MIAKHRRRRGFTLFELLLVMAILVMSAAIAYPTIMGWYGDSRVKASADDIRGAWALARAHAIDEGVNYRFAVNYDTGRFKVAPDDTDHWNNSDDAQDADEVTATGLSLRKTLPKGILFTPDPDGNSPQADATGWATLITFLPDGTCKDDAKIIIDGDHVAPLTLRMRGLTGTSVTETK